MLSNVRGFSTYHRDADGGGSHGQCFSVGFPHDLRRHRCLAASRGQAKCGSASKVEDTVREALTVMATRFPYINGGVCANRRPPLHPAQSRLLNRLFIHVIDYEHGNGVPFLDHLQAKFLLECFING